MPPSMLTSALRRIGCALLLLAFLRQAHAQKAAPLPYPDRQSPISLTTANAPYNPNAPVFDNTGMLNNAVNYLLINTTGKQWCTGCAGTVDQRWGSLKASPVLPVKIQFGGSTYTLIEFHFHAPAEHTVNGILTEMEMHFVFSKDGSDACAPDALLVIGKRIRQSSTENEAAKELEKIFGPGITLPTNYKNDPVPLRGFVAGKVLGNLSRSYRYTGSLTAPMQIDSCPNPPGNPDQQLQTGFFPQVVSWVLLDEPAEMTAEEIDRFRKLFRNGDARGLQEILVQGATRTFR